MIFAEMPPLSKVLARACRHVPIRSYFIYNNVNKLFIKVAKAFLKQLSHVLKAFAVNMELKLQCRNTDIRNMVGIIILLLLIPDCRCCIIYGM